jgi:hypothetical protein
LGHRDGPSQRHLRFAEPLPALQDKSVIIEGFRRVGQRDAAFQRRGRAFDVALRIENVRQRDMRVDKVGPCQRLGATAPQPPATHRVQRGAARAN